MVYFVCSLFSCRYFFRSLFIYFHNPVISYVRYVFLYFVSSVVLYDFVPSVFRYLVWLLFFHNFGSYSFMSFVSQLGSFFI